MCYRGGQQGAPWFITLNAARALVVISGDVSETVWSAVLTGVWTGEKGCLLLPIQYATSMNNCPINIALALQQGSST